MKEDLNKDRGDAVLDVTLLGHAEARGVDELWAGKTDSKERRRLQNRLNRRAYRKRQAEQKLIQQREMTEAGVQPPTYKRARGVPGVHMFALETPDTKAPAGAIPLDSLVVASRSSRERQLCLPSSSASPASSTPPEQRFGPLEIIQSWRLKFEEQMQCGIELLPAQPLDSRRGDPEPVVNEESTTRRGDSRGPLPSPEDRLLNLMYYNVFRGLSGNIKALKLDPKCMLSWSYISPFVTGEADLSTLAPDFQPTFLQQTVPHHPCFDIFPDPVVRDNAIRHWYVDKHPMKGRLCLVLAGRRTWHENDLSLRRGVALWGEADMVENWEVTEGFAHDWPFLLEGAVRLEAATNWYRALRGEPALMFA